MGGAVLQKGEAEAEVRPLRHSAAPVTDALFCHPGGLQSHFVLGHLEKRTNTHTPSSLYTAEGCREWCQPRT